MWKLQFLYILMNSLYKMGLVLHFVSYCLEFDVLFFYSEETWVKVMFKIKKGNQLSSHAGTFFLCCKVVFHFASHKEVCFQFVCLHDDLGSPKEKIKMPGQYLQLSTTPDHYRKMMMKSKTIKNSMCGKKIEFLTLLHLV